MNSFRPIFGVQLLSIFVFFTLKQLRPALLQAFPNEAFEIFLYSFPNFAEGVVGYLIVAMILTMASWRSEFVGHILTVPRLCICAFLAAGTYVISQELGLHHIGGAQVYDPYDIVFSIAGLIAGLLVFVWQRPNKAPPELS
jgi:hypothetical protein